MSLISFNGARHILVHPIASDVSTLMAATEKTHKENIFE